MSDPQKLKCLFGFHNYTIPDKYKLGILICKHCKRFGYYKGVYGDEIWYKLNEKGDIIHSRYSDGFKQTGVHDKRGKLVGAR